MLSEEENRTLTQVAPGTPMGDLLRRYWQPIAAVKELEERPTKRLRLLGEHLVLYKDLSGNYGLLEARCAHRGTDLSYGIVEEYGLRCFLHGWLYGENGQCLDQPLEETPFAHEVKVNGYPVQAKAGLLWAYLGPAPVPFVPDWEPFAWDDGLVQIVFAELPCNWLQIQENAMDAVDVELFHERLRRRDAVDAPAPAFRDLATAFEEFEYGFTYRRAPRAAAADPNEWSVGRTCLWPNGLFSGDARSCRFEWRVPLDDAATLSVAWFIDRIAPGTDLPLDERYHYWHAPLRDEESGELIDSHLLNRSFAIWTHQPTILDRANEHLVESDRGVVMLRDKYFSQIGLIADGGTPKAVLLDPAANQRLHLPFTAPLAPPVAGERREAGEIVFPYLAGQPPEVEAAYRRVVATWENAATKESARPRAPRRRRRVQ